MKTNKITTHWWVFVCAFLCAAGCRQQSEIRLSSQEMIKYLDKPMLAVSRTGQNRVTLIALGNEERVIGTVPVACKGPFGLAFSNRSWLYVACWDHSQVVLIDLKSDKKPTIFQGAKLPAWIQSRDGSNEVWISNEGAGTVSIYRSGSTSLLGEIKVGRGPSDIAFSDEGRKVWVSNETSGDVSVIDAEKRTKIRDIPVGKVPQGMALNSTGDELLVTNFGSDSISVIETSKEQETARIPVCAGPIDVATVARGDVEFAYVSCYKAGSVAVVDLKRRQIIERIPVGEKPFGVVSHPRRKRVCVCVGGADEVIVIDPGQSSRIIRRIKLKGNPLQIAIAP